MPLPTSRQLAAVTCTTAKIYNTQEKLDPLALPQQLLRPGSMRGRIKIY